MDILACPICYKPWREIGDFCFYGEPTLVDGILDLRPVTEVRLSSQYMLETARYEKVAEAGPEKYGGLAETKPELRAKLLKDLLLLRGVESFVNIGPGFGYLERITDGFDRLALDPCLGFLQRIKDELPDVQVVRGVAEYLPFQDESVECLVSESTFQSIVNRELFLYEVGRVTAPGALIVITIGYRWNYPRRPQNGFNVKRREERQVLWHFLEELGFSVREEILVLKSGTFHAATMLGDYLWIIGEKDGR